MRVEIDLKKSIEENASFYFEKGKKARGKLGRLEKAIINLESEISGIDKKQEAKTMPGSPLKKRKQQWFEKYHWFFTSDGFLVIGGKDARQNEEIIKNRMEDTDIFFHADIFGAPHCILKSKDNKAPEKSMEEAAQFAAVFSRAWQSETPMADVYSADPSQISKEAPSGESIGKGAFMVYGERKWFRRTQLSFAIGVEKTPGGFRVVSGPESAIKKNSVVFLRLFQGKDKKSDAAKKIRNLFQKKIPELAVDLDEIMQLLPSGGMKIEA